MSSDDKSTQRDWRDIAEQASNETDPEKLQKLVRELCDALDHRKLPLEQSRPVNKKRDVAE